MIANQILVVEDTASLQTLYCALLESVGHHPVAVGSLSQARAVLQNGAPPIVLLDLLLPDGDGLDLLAELVAQAPATKVIVITANGSVDKAVEAMRIGAFDFLLKPIDPANLVKAVTNARSERHQHLRATPTALPLGGFIGSSPVMQQVYSTIRAVAGSMATVFVTGESGAGKEIAAEAIHALSSQSDGPFVPLNCGAIPSGFLESEVFGHVAGAFPAAISDKRGAAEDADGGTLFLDEVCEMDLGLQARFLRFLQTSTVTPLGAAEGKRITTRIICATSRDPLEEVRAGRLRADLYYRLHVVPLHLPPLRDRGHDVVEIAEAMLSRFATREGRSFRALDDEVKQLFLNYSWPGNVRQLLNVLWNVVVLNDGPVVTRATLPPNFLDTGGDMTFGGTGQVATHQPLADIEAFAGMTLAEIERIAIEATIEREGGSVPQAARVLDVSPSTLYRKLEAWGRPARPRK